MCWLSVACPPPGESTLAQVDPKFRDANGQWVGTSGRLRVLVYDSSKLKTEDLPRTLAELADPKWKGKSAAPTNGSLHAHVSALRHAWGEEKTKEWMKVVEASTRYSKNSPQVAAANEGAIELGWVNHYYLHRLDKDGRTAKTGAFPSRVTPETC